MERETGNSDDRVTLGPEELRSLGDVGPVVVESEDGKQIAVDVDYEQDGAEAMFDIGNALGDAADEWLSDAVRLKRSGGAE